MALTTQERDNIVKLAVGMFNAAPGSTYLQEFTAFFEANGRSLSSLANYFAGSSAYKGIYPNFQSAAEFASTFLTPLGLQANTVATDFVTSRFNKGQSTQSIMLDTLIALDATTDSAFTTAKAILNNKTSVATTYSLTNSALTLSALQAVVSSVDATAASVTAANAANSSASGNTFTLTTGVDAVTFKGGSGADAYTAVIDFAGGSSAGALSTLTAGDSIDAGGGVDTMNLTLQNSNGTAIAVASAPTAQVNTYVFATPSAASTPLTVTYGGTSTVITLGATPTATQAGAALATALNALAGSTIASNSAGTVTVTAPVAGTALPAIGFSGAASVANYPAITATTANATASTGIDLGNTTNIEVYKINNNTTSSVTINAQQVPNATDFVTDRSISALTLTNLAKGANIGVNGDGVTAQGALTASYAATATTVGVLNVTGGVNGSTSGLVSWTTPGQVTALTVNSTGGAQSSSGGQVNTLGGLTLSSGVTTLNINATTSLTTGAITATGLTTIIASGAATTVTPATSTGAVPTSVTTIDGSGLTAGGISAVLTGAVTSFKGGAGADTITTGATTAAGAVIDGGGGAADILVLAATNDVTTAGKAAQYTNFEILRNTTSGSVDTALFTGITSVQANATGAGFTNMTAAQAAAVLSRVSGGTNNGATFALADSSGTNDVLTVTLNNSTTNTGSTLAENLTAVTANGFETMNVISSSGASAAHSSLSFTAATSLTKLNLSGVAPLDVSTSNLLNATAIDASAMTFSPAAGTYTFTITGNLIKGSTVTATAKDDSITTTAAITGTTGDYVVYAAGAGNDVISSTAAAINNTSAANGSVKIDGGIGTDTLTLTDTGSLTLADNNFQFVTGIETISYTVANKAISITGGGYFDSNFKASGATLTLGDATNAQANTVNASTFTGNATVSLTATAATTAAQAITTGSGADSATLLAAGTTTGAHTISTGAGNDTVAVTISGTTITTGSVTINGGLGQDSITITGNSTVNADAASNAIITVNEGASTVAAADSVTGWVLNGTTYFASSLDFDGTEAVSAAISSTASVISGINYAVANGLMTFSGTNASALTAAQKAQIAQAAITVADAVVVFTDGSDSYVFHNGATAANAGDSLVKLVGVTALGAETATGTTGYVLV